jgi:hypothetical protein
LGLVAMYGVLLRKHWIGYTLVMALGALCLVAGNALWMAGQPIYVLVHWWMAFLILTIAGERQELSRVTQPTPASQRAFVLAVAILAAGVLLTPLALGLGIRVAGVGQLALALWMLRFDVARRTLFRGGVARYIAICLLVGYLWLGVAGGIGIFYGAVYAGFVYDALLHAVLLGFVFSMIFGHAPIILPALTGLLLPYRPLFYGHLILLHASLLLREVGDLSSWLPGRMWGGLFNVVAILLFLAVTLLSVRRRDPQMDLPARKQARTQPGPAGGMPVNKLT